MSRTHCKAHSAEIRPLTTHESLSGSTAALPRKRPSALAAAPAFVLGALMLTPCPLSASSPLPFNQAAVKQGTDPALHGPDASKPYFTVRFAMPIPPDNDYSNMGGTMVGVDEAVADYNHSPAFEIMPNGDVLVAPYSAPGTRESGATMRIVQARLRHGAEEFDMPEEIHVQGAKLQDLRTADGKRALYGPPLMWRDGATVWLFIGFGWGWGVDHPYRFRVFKSEDSGATWEIVALEPEFSSMDADPQPITNAFRAPNGDMFVALDAKLGAPSSKLWRSPDNGLTWHDQGGLTSSRHSTIVPLDSNGTLLSVGGKDTSMHPDGKKVIADGSVKGGGYMPQNISKDWGKTWGPPTTSPFPWLGGNQRPSAIRLANGNLVMVGDSRNNGSPNGVPHQWTHGDAPYAAHSSDNGQTWTIKPLPVALPHSTRIHKTLGYTTVRQAPNGLIHVLSSRTHPMLHYTFNENWITTRTAGDIVPKIAGGEVRPYSENYSGGTPKAAWSARITSIGQYLLDGPETHYYQNGTKQREVTWVNGRRNGEETLWGPDGTRIWSWNHNLAHNISTWTHWWPNGQKRLESQWNTNPTARDLPNRHFRGLVAHGTAWQWNEEGDEVAAHTFLNGVRISQRGNHTEEFHEKSPDPGKRGWTGSGNVGGGNDFKWSPGTTYCAFMNRPFVKFKGEVGGVFARSKEYRWYADTDIGAKDRTHSLHMAGNLQGRVQDGNYEGTFRIGYFNTASPAKNFIGIEFREPAGTVLDPEVQHSGHVYRAYLAVYGPGGAISKVPFEPFLHGSHPKTFDLIWSGNPDGSGTLSGTLTSLPISIMVPPGSGSFNAFGILAGGDSSDDLTKKTDLFHFDNLTYDKGTVTSYKVTYNANGGTGGVLSAQTKPDGVDLPLSAGAGLVRTGFTFAGWNTAADGSGTSYAPGAIYSSDSTVTLHAMWQKPAP
jgi:uncharacterized repeat protein (TIGR02543 family)